MKMINSKMGVTMWLSGGIHFGDKNEYEFDAYVGESMKNFQKDMQEEMEKLESVNNAEELLTFLKGIKSVCEPLTDDEVDMFVTDNCAVSVLDYNINNENGNYILQFNGVNFLVED